jgi:DNA-directed RNA polymerase subunit RPC12/RpoP
MEEICRSCHGPLTIPWNFCPNCGAAVEHEAHKHAAPAEAEKAPVRNAFSGLALGVLIAPAMLILGSLLCLTGLGAILGIPLIIGAVIAPLAGPVIGFGAVKGKCPWCGAAVSSLHSRQSFDCDACHRRIALKNEKFVACS